MTAWTDQKPHTEEWPEGVIARYLTVGGATVDIERQQSDPYDYDSGGYSIRSVDVTVTLRCTGARCPETDSTTFSLVASAVGGSLDQSQTQRIQERAQGHAERCRAMPTPEAASR